MFCGCVVKYNGSAAAALCPSCAAKLDACGHSIGRFTRAGVVCAAAFEYRDEVRERLLEMKSRDHKEHARCFAAYLAPVVRGAYRDIRFDAVCCVPGYEPEKRVYNQARVLARRLSEELGLPLLAQALEQTGEKQRQHTLDAPGRFLNVRDVYAVPEKEAQSVSFRTILLVDDIVTTGATFASCCLKLREAGASAVFCAAVARTEENGKAASADSGADR